jgi:hypothetical protein
VAACSSTATSIQRPGGRTVCSDRAVPGLFGRLRTRFLIGVREPAGLLIPAPLTGAVGIPLPGNLNGCRAYGESGVDRHCRGGFVTGQRVPPAGRSGSRRTAAHRPRPPALTRFQLAADPEGGPEHLVREQPPSWSRTLITKHPPGSHRVRTRCEPGGCHGADLRELTFGGVVDVGDEQFGFGAEVVQRRAA